MKSLLILLILLAPQAFATKARVNSLQGARFLTDNQFFFENPAQMMSLEKGLMVLEAGQSNLTSSANAKAEGGIFKNIGKNKIGMYLGHVDPMESTIRQRLDLSAGDTNYRLPENPIHFFFGTKDMAASIGYSRTRDRTTSPQTEQEYLQLSAGIDRGDFEAWANLNAVQTAKGGGFTYKNAPGLNVGGEYHLSEGFYVTGEAFYSQIDSRSGAVKNDGNLKGVSVTFLDRTIKGTDYAIYFGPGLEYTSWDINGPDIEVFAVPVYLGIQHSLRDWLELRSSISQNFLLGSAQDETRTPPLNGKSTIGNNTTVTIGAGASWKQFVFDFTFAGSTNGNVDGGNLLANGALSFHF